MAQREGSAETGYGWVIVFCSLAIHTIGLGSPIVLLVALKPIAAEFDWPRSVPSLAYSMMMIGTGAGGILMGWWMDKRGVFQPVLFGAVMIGIGALVASQSEGKWSLYVANGLLIGLLGKAAMITPLIANVTHWFDRRRGLAVAIIASGQGLAGAIWPPLFRYLKRFLRLARDLSFLRRLGTLRHGAACSAAATQGRRSRGRDGPVTDKPVAGAFSVFRRTGFRACSVWRPSAAVRPWPYRSSISSATAPISALLGHALPSC